MDGVLGRGVSRVEIRAHESKNARRRAVDASRGSYIGERELGAEACACVTRALEVNGAETTTASEDDDEDEDAPTTMTRDALEHAEEDDAPYVFVVETAEFDEPAREAREGVKMILKRAANDSLPPPPRRFAVVMIGDCDIIGERAAYRCNQNVVDDCNRCGIAVETALRRGLGWRRVGDACKLDRSKVEDDAWARHERCR